MGNVNMEASQINYRGGEKKMSVEEALKNTSGEAAAIAQLQEDVADLNGSKANRVDIATEFSDLTNYNAGDLVYYEGDLYEFQVDHTAGSWETSEVIQKDLSDIITTLKSGLKSGITGNFPVTYVQGWQIIKHITFDEPFNTVPAVLLQSLFTGGANGDVYEPANITVNGFDINMYSPVAGSFDYYNFSWIATQTS